MADEYEIHKNKRPDKTYSSRNLAFKSQNDRRIRIASKVIDSSETHTFAFEHGEHVIRVTDMVVRKSSRNSTKTTAASTS